MIEAHSQDRSFDNSRLTNTVLAASARALDHIMCARSFDTHVVRGWKKGVAEGATRKRPSGAASFLFQFFCNKAGSLAMSVAIRRASHGLFSRRPSWNGWLVYIFNSKSRPQSGGGRLCSAGGLDDTRLLCRHRAPEGRVRAGSDHGVSPPFLGKGRRHPVERHSAKGLSLRSTH